MSRKIYRLHDSVIAAIARALQQALLTGTDISDHMRMMRLEEMRDDPDTLVMTDEYLKQEDEMHKRMVEEAEKLSERNSGDDETLAGDVSPFMMGDGSGGEHGPN